MKTKNILVVIHNLNMGGIQKSFIEFLKSVSAVEKCRISVFCCCRSGILAQMIPDGVDILPNNNYALVSESSLGRAKMLGKKYYYLRFLLSLWTKCFSKAFPSKILCRLIGKIGEGYDVAISYSQPQHDRTFSNLTNEIVLNCVDARKKVTFLHCDFAVYGGNTALNRKLYSKFDCIAAVSDSVGQRFAEVVPNLADKIQTVYNFCDCKEVLALAADNPVFYKKTTFVTVARLSEEKGLLRCVPLFQKLRAEGFDFEWHIVGGGPLRAALDEEIRKNGLNDCIYLDGEQINPYRYVKNADYFFLPSFHEAAPMVFNEALTLEIPILTTRTLSAKELIESRNIGIVCENESDSIFEMLDSVLKTKPYFDMNQTPLNDIALEQFCELCELNDEVLK